MAKVFSRLPLAMAFATVMPPHGRPGWLTAAGSLMGPAIAMSSLLEGELKAYNTSSNSTIEFWLY